MIGMDKNIGQTKRTRYMLLSLSSDIAALKWLPSCSLCPRPPFSGRRLGPWSMIPQLESPVQFSGSSRNKPFGASAVLVGYINGG